MSQHGVIRLRHHPHWGWLADFSGSDAAIHVAATNNGCCIVPCPFTRGCPESMVVAQMQDLNAGYQVEVVPCPMS